MRTRFLIATLLVLALAPLARADGLPVAETGGPATIAGNSGRYMAVPTARGTLVVHYGAVVFASQLLKGRFMVPVVGLDGTPSGMSIEGSTLVLIDPRRSFPRAQTSLAVLDAHNMQLRSKIVLDGDYSFDALSPDGTRMYLIHYESNRDPTKYEVLAYDLEAHRLLPDAIVDPTEVDEQMRGLPITRVMSPDGRFAYTLYDGAGKAPFVHALDTVKGEARCIDLDMLAGDQDLYNLRLGLSVGGTKLAVRRGSNSVAVVDTRTYLSNANRTLEASSRNWSRIAAFLILALLGTVAALVAARRQLTNRRARVFRPGPERRSAHPAAGPDGASGRRSRPGSAPRVT
jgi:hypothetical protein